MTWFDSHRDTISHHELKKGVVLFLKGFHAAAAAATLKLVEIA